MSIKILIVESDSRQTELAMGLINEVARAHVDSTNSGERALELISKTTYQLVIVDCTTGDPSLEIDGVSILERVKRASPSTGVILTSPFATIEEAVKAVRFGADEYFKKPYDVDQFKLAVKRCLDRRALFTGDQSIAGLMHLLNACQIVSGSLDEARIMETVMGYVKREANPEGIALFRVTKDRKTRIPTTLDQEADVVEVLVEGQNFLPATWAGASTNGHQEAMRVIARTSSSPEVAVFRFLCTGDQPYYIVCTAPRWQTKLDEVGSRYRLLQAQIQMTGRNITNYRGVKHLIYLDEPTGLFNTRYLHQCLDQQFELRSKNPRHTFSVLFLDVDKFKHVNDNHGHLVGTKLLQEMGEIIKSFIRKTDFAFRYGGDEFVVLLVGMKTGDAFVVAERIRAEIEKRKFMAAQGLNMHLTVSIGVANCPEHATEKRDFIHAADDAMYAVKQSTRNNVYVAEKRKAA